MVRGIVTLRDRRLKPWLFLLGLAVSGWLPAQEAVPPAPAPVAEAEGEEVQRLRVDSLVEAGLGPGWNLVRANAWSPVAVTLINQGIGFDGHVEVTFSPRTGSARDPRRYRRSYRFPVSLERRIKGEDSPVKRYSIPVFFEEEDGEVWTTLTVRRKGWFGGGETLELARTPVTMLGNDEQLVLAVSYRPGEHNHLAETVAGLRPRRVVNAPPDRLPEVWAAYTGADAVLLDTRGLLDVTSGALEALMAYVAAGGKLIVCGGGAHTVLQQEPWRSVLPVRVSGYRMIATPSLLGERYGSPGSLAGDLLVATAEAAESSELVLAEGELPLIVRRHHGLGTVYYVAFSLSSSPIRQWGGRRSLARSLFAPDRPPFPLERPADDAERQIEISLLTGQLMDLPPRRVVGVFLLSYLFVAVPLNYMILRRLSRRELVWTTLPLMAAVFSAAIFAYNHFTRTQRMSLCAFGVLATESGSTHGRARTFWTVYSPSRTSLGMGFDDPRTLPSEPLSGLQDPGLDAEPIGFSWERTLEVSHLPIRHQSNRVFASSGVYAATGSVISDLVYDGEWISGTVENRTGDDVYECHLMSGNVGTRLGLLRAGGRVEVRMRPREDLRPVDARELQFPRRGVPGEDASLWVADRAWELGYPLVQQQRGLHLVGLRLASPVRPKGGREVSVLAECTLYLVSIPVRIAPGKEVPADRHLISAEICASGVSAVGQAETFPVSMYSGEWVTATLRPEGVDLSRGELSSFGFHARVMAPDPRGPAYERNQREAESGEVRTQLFNRRTSTWDDFPALGREFHVERWEDYVDPKAPEALVRVMISEQVRPSLEFQLDWVAGIFWVRGGSESST